MAGIYIHVPFCKKRCIYCDFYSTTHSDMKDKYIHALCKEIEYRKNYTEGEDIETIYFGGGTPSQLEATDFEKVFQTIYDNFKVNPSAEITLEANPDDMTDEYLNTLKTLPFNRLSMGFQTFNDNTLQLLGRRHTATQATDAFHRCRKAGFKNISIDLMYGLPGETLEIWKKDLSIAVSLKPEHISAYHLIYEEGTILSKLREEQTVKEADEDLSLTLFETLITTLKEYGYEHYEISNFCMPGFHSRHNSSYWTGSKYLGCGPSAHSYNGKNRQWNASSLHQYIAAMESISSEEKERIFEMEELDLYTKYNDFVITSIRTKWGMPLDRLKNEFGEELYNYCLKMAATYIKSGKLKKEGSRLVLSEEGIFISDGIMSDLLWA